MGRVIKGSASSLECFTVALPAGSLENVRALEPAGVFGDDGGDPFALFDADRRIGAAAAAPAEPEVDLEAVAAQAQSLIDEATRHAEALVAEAGERAARIVADGVVDAARASDEARRSGQREGYVAGEAAAHDEMRDMLAALRDLLEAARRERHALVTAAEPELVRLALGIAERVLHQQVALDGGVVVEMARAAIARIVDREKLTVRVNPADVERMREHRDELLALGDVKTMRVIEDQRVDRGGVVVETDAGTVDAKISTQLAEVRQVLHIVDDVVVQPAASARHDLDAGMPPARAS